jgi:hypothetical protein
MLALLLSAPLVSCANSDKLAQAPDRSLPETKSAGDLTGMTVAMAMRVFRDLCMANPTDEGARRSWLQTMGFQIASRQVAAMHLTSGAGTVWMRPDPPSAGFPLAVVTRSSGIQCEVRSPLAEPRLASTEFTRIVQGTATPGLVIRKDADEQTAPGGGPGSFVSYRVGAAPIEKGGFIFGMSARPPVPGRIALLITASRAAPE